MRRPGAESRTARETERLIGFLDAGTSYAATEFEQSTDNEPRQPPVGGRKGGTSNRFRQQNVR